MNYHITSLLISLVAVLVYPALFIWAVNTLFACGIPLTFKTWLASLVLFLSVRFFVNKTYTPPDDYYDYESDEDEDEDEDYEDEEEDDDDDDDDNPPPHRRHIRRVK